MGCPLEKLTALESLHCALPNSLRCLTLHLPLMRGIPAVLVRLTNLLEFNVIHTGEGLMHLDRPLDPFLDMMHLKLLTFSKFSQGLAGRIYRWTPGALKFLGLQAGAF